MPSAIKRNAKNKLLSLSRQVAVLVETRTPVKKSKVMKIERMLI